jgi:hypothetical protein
LAILRKFAVGFQKASATLADKYVIF